MAEFDPSTAKPEGDFDPSTATPYTPPKSSAIRRGIGDTAISLGQGAVGAVKALTDATGANNRVSSTLGNINEGLQGLLSPERQEEMRNRAAIIDEADKSGSTLNEVTARLGGFVEAPLQTVAQGIGSIVPTVAAALATRGRSAAAQIGASSGIGAVQAVGGVKGQNYDAVLNEALARGLPQAEAEALAQRAAEYSPENAPQQLLAGGLGALAGSTGVERIIGGAVTGDGLRRRVIKGALSEGLPEGAQGAQQQFAQNVALNNAGFETDASTGVLGQGLLEGIVGGVIGAGAGVPKQDARAPAAPPTSAPSQPPAAPSPAPTTEPYLEPTPDSPAAPPVTGPLTSGVAAMRPAAIDSLPPLPTGQAQELDGQDAARVQREAMRPAEPTGDIQPGDITRDGKPFTSMESASRALAKAGPGHELARVTGGLVVRPIGTAPATPAQRRPAAQGDPLAQFAADNADDNADDLLLAGRNTLPGMRTGGVDTRELSLDEAQAMLEPPAAAPEKRIPTGKATELPVETVEPPAPPAPEVRREPRTPKPQATRGMTDADVVRAYVEQRRSEGTLAGRRFAGDFDAGRITPEEVLALVRPRTTPTPDERLAAAAAQRPTPAPAPGLVDAEGRPIPTTIRERREQQRQPDVAAATREPAGPGDGRGDNAGGSGVAVGSVSSAPGRVVQPADRAGAGNLAPDAVADGRGADAALTPKTLRQQWTEAVNRGDADEARRLNDLIVAEKAQRTRTETTAPVDTSRGRVQETAESEQVAAAPAPQAPPQGRAPEAAAPAPQVSTWTPEPAAEPAAAQEVGGFDSAAWDKARADRIKASREAGNVHLDTLDAYVETMRGKAIRSVHDPKVKGTIFTVDNNRNVFVDWADAYSQEKEGAVPMQYGKRKFMQSTLGPRDLKDYVLDVPADPQVSTRTPAPAPAPTNPPAPAAQTRPERLIELRKRQSVLKQLLECLG